MGKKKEKETPENVVRQWHPDLPIEITGMTEEQIKKEIIAFKKNREKQKNT